MRVGDRKRISAFKEWRLLTRQYILILFSDVKNLMVALLFPVVAAGITVWIAGENMYVNYEGTKSACFVLVSAAIWGGIFNSIQVVVKERANIRRDYATGLRIRVYTLSRASIQGILCLIQGAILCASFPGVCLAYDNKLPEAGIIFEHPIMEYYISIVLLMFAADAMGLMISSFVKKSETASVMAPYILIVQLIFSGILFTMKGIADKMSYTMLSRWGMEALGSISDLNSLQLKIQATVPEVPHEAEEMFTHSVSHLRNTWIVLAVFSVLFLICGNMALHKVSKDTR